LSRARKPAGTTAATLVVRLTPRGGRDAIEGWAEDESGRDILRVRVAAPPVEGAANAALVALIARRLKLPLRAVRLAGGELARQKRLVVQGVTQEQLRRSLQPD